MKQFKTFSTLIKDVDQKGRVKWLRKTDEFGNRYLQAANIETWRAHMEAVKRLINSGVGSTMKNKF